MPSAMDGQKMQDIYHAVDTDNNGYITRDELQTYKEKNGLNDLNVDVSQDVVVARDWYILRGIYGDRKENHDINFVFCLR